MVVSVCLSSNLYYSLLGFFSDCLSVCWPVTQTFCVLCMSSLPVYVCVCLIVCLSVWENDRMGFRLLFESIFILLSTSSNKSGGNSTRPHGPLKICPKRVLSTCHVDNDNVSSAVRVPALDAVSISFVIVFLTFFGTQLLRTSNPVAEICNDIFFNICVPFPFQKKGN